jgi:hypothetical protein
MFPLFYVNPHSKKTSLYRKPGYLPVLKQGAIFVIQSTDEEFQPCEDESWVVNTFRNMMFLDQCYWT